MCVPRGLVKSPVIGLSIVCWFAGEGLAIDRLEHRYVVGEPGPPIPGGLYEVGSGFARFGEWMAGYSDTLTQLFTTSGFPDGLFVDELCGFLFFLGNSATPAITNTRKLGARLNFTQQTFVIPTPEGPGGQWDVQRARRFFALVLSRCRERGLRPFSVDLLHLQEDDGLLSATRGLAGFAVTITFADHDRRAVALDPGQTFVARFQPRHPGAGRPRPPGQARRGRAQRPPRHVPGRLSHVPGRQGAAGPAGHPRQRVLRSLLHRLEALVRALPLAGALALDPPRPWRAAPPPRAHRPPPPRRPRPYRRRCRRCLRPTGPRPGAGTPDAHRRVLQRLRHPERLGAGAPLPAPLGHRRRARHRGRRRRRRARHRRHARKLSPARGAPPRPHRAGGGAFGLPRHAGRRRARRARHGFGDKLLPNAHDLKVGLPNAWINGEAGPTPSTLHGRHRAHALLARAPHRPRRGGLAGRRASPRSSPCPLRPRARRLASWGQSLHQHVGYYDVTRDHRGHAATRWPRTSASAAASDASCFAPWRPTAAAGIASQLRA